jgi:hypothetical protein
LLQHSNAPANILWLLRRQVRYAQQRDLNLPQPESFVSQTGHGVIGLVEEI